MKIMIDRDVLRILWENNHIQMNRHSEIILKILTSTAKQISIRYKRKIFPV